MSARASHIARWIVRFIFAAAVYLTTCSVWISNAKGWDGLGLLGASIGFGVIFAVSWLIAITFEHFYLRNLRIRLLLYPVALTGLFLIISLLVLTGYFGDPIETFWRDATPFAGLVAAAALLDVAADAVLARKLGT